MSFVIAAPDLVQGAAQDLAGIRASLAEAAAMVAGPTTGVVPAAADEVSAAISAMFGNFGQQFQVLSAQAQAFHGEFVSLMNAGAGAYLNAEIANAEQAAMNAISGAGSVGAAGATPGAGSSLLGGLLGGSGGSSGVTGLLGGLTGGSSPVTGLLGGLTGGTSGVGGLLGGLTGGSGGLGGLVGGLAPTLNSLLPGLLNVQVGGSTGTGFTGILGPYEALFANTATNFQSLLSGWLADPYPFLRQVAANWIGYGQIAATALTTGNLQLLSTIPADISHNASNVFATLTNFSITPHLQVLSLLPLSLTLDTFVGLPLVAGIDLIGAPVATFEAATFSFGAFTSALATGNLGGAFAAAIDAPAVIANGFLNGQATLPFGLSLSGLPVLGNVADVEASLNLPLDGILHPPGFYAATVTVTVPGVLPPTTVDVGVGGTPFSGLAPFIVNYAPQQLAHAIGAPLNSPPLIDLPLISI
jgi:hypothetical protein